MFTMTKTAMLALLLMLATTPAIAEDVEAGYALCAKLQATGYVPECTVNGWNSTVDFRADLSSSVAIDLCAKITGDVVISSQFLRARVRDDGTLAPKWTLRIFSPYSGEHPLAVCSLG